MTILPIPLSEELKNVFDALTLSSAITAFVSSIPIIMGLLTICWTVYRIYDLRLSIKLKKQQLKED